MAGKNIFYIPQYEDIDHRVKHYKDVGGTHGSTFGNENTKALLEKIILGRTWDWKENEKKKLIEPIQNEYWSPLFWKNLHAVT